MKYSTGFIGYRVKRLFDSPIPMVLMVAVSEKMGLASVEPLPRREILEGLIAMDKLSSLLVTT